MLIRCNKIETELLPRLSEHFSSVSSLPYPELTHIPVCISRLDVGLRDSDQIETQQVA